MGAGLVSFIMTVTGVTAGTASAIATFATTLIANFALGKLSKLLTKKPRTEVPPINVTIRNPIENRRLVFGSARCGGTFAFIGSSGENNQYLWYVIVLAGHQVHAIRDVWLDTVRVPNANINGGDANGGAVTGMFNGKLRVFKHLGTSAQSADTNLTAAFPGQWTGDHKLSGCAYIVVRMERDDEAYPSGAPGSVSALVDGALCYDPRKDDTVPGGSGDHRKDDPRTWEFTRNPALHARWFLTGGSVHNDLDSRLVRYGPKIADASVPDSYVVAAANICDEHLTDDNTTPIGDEFRYRCDLEVSTGESRREIIEDILATMAGTIVWVHGEYRIYAGAYDTPEHVLTQDDLYGSLQIEDTWDHRRRYNSVAGVYRDALKQYVEQTTIFRTDDDYVEQDGDQDLPIEIDLRGVTSVYQAQRLCEIKLRQSRMQRTVNLVGALNLLKCAPHETLTYTHTRYNWNQRIFRVQERQFQFTEDAGRVVLTCVRDDPAVWADLETADYDTGTSQTDRFVTDTPNLPTNVRANGLPNAIEVAWDQPAFYTGGTRYRVQEASMSDMSDAIDIALTPDRQIVVRKDTITTYYYRVRAELSGQVTDWVPSGTGVSATPLSVLGELTAFVSPGGLDTFTEGATATSGSATVVANGGTPPYTYAWTRVSGDNTITADSDTSATTTFSVTGLTPGEVNEATFRCTVTDSAMSPEVVTVDIPVRFERQGLIVTASSVSGSRSGFPACGNVSTDNSPNVMISNGSGIYSYSWSQVGTPATNGPYTPDNASAQNPTWSGAACVDDPVSVETWRVTVTDLLTSASASTDITVTLTWVSLT